MSKFQLQKLREIDQTRKDTVTGYIRGDESLKDKQIPRAIIYICILFYGEGADQFDPRWKGNAMTLSNDNRRVEYKGVTYQSVYGKKIVHSGYHEWKFKLIKMSGSDCAIGLWRCSENTDPPINLWFCKGHNQGYAVRYDGLKNKGHNGGFGEKFCAAYKTADVIEMFVDFDQLSLCWKVNGKSYGKSHDITQDKYRLAIYMYSVEKIVEIMDE